MDRPDWERAIKMPLAVLPGGSGNGLTASLLHIAKETFSAFNAAFLVARGTSIVNHALIVGLYVTTVIVLPWYAVTHE